MFADNKISQQLHVEARTSTDERIVEKQRVSDCIEFDVVKLHCSSRSVVIIVSKKKPAVQMDKVNFDFSTCMFETQNNFNPNRRVFLENVWHGG